MNHRAAAGITQEQPPEPQRRELLKCMLWAGSALLWTVSAGIPKSRLISNAYAGDAPTEGFSFAQISDSHIGFPGPANVDVTGTLQLAMRHVVALKKRTSLLIHTGDISHLGQDKELDTAKQIIDSAGFETHYVPGEHDMLVDNGKGFYARFSPKDARALGAYTLDTHGVHFIALNNVSNFHAGGLGQLGAAQLEWVKRDLKGRPASQPIIILAHMPLWSIYPEWGWGTDESADLLAALKRFGSVTVLNGHIHQVLQKVEGHVTFHTALSTAFPLPPPGSGPAPIPVKLPADRLAAALGTAWISQVSSDTGLAVVEQPLGA